MYYLLRSIVGQRPQWEDLGSEPLCRCEWKGKGEGEQHCDLELCELGTRNQKYEIAQRAVDKWQA